MWPSIWGYVGADQRRDHSCEHAFRTTKDISSKGGAKKELAQRGSAFSRSQMVVVQLGALRRAALRLPDPCN